MKANVTSMIAGTDNEHDDGLGLSKDTILYMIFLVTITMSLKPHIILYTKDYSLYIICQYPHI